MKFDQISTEREVCLAVKNENAEVGFRNFYPNTGESKYNVHPNRQLLTKCVIYQGYRR